MLLTEDCVLEVELRHLKTQGQVLSTETCVLLYGSRYGLYSYGLYKYDPI